MKILITGANGFVGSRLMKSLDGAIPSPSLRGMEQRQIQDIFDHINPDVIIHTAAISNTSYCHEHPQESWQSNVLLPEKIARAARHAKLIMFSSDQVYNGQQDPGPYNEDMILTPASVYADHKLKMEQRVSDIRGAVFLRAEWMYDYQAERMGYWQLIRSQLHEQKPLKGSTNTYRGLTYMREVERVFPNVLLLPDGVYNFGSETLWNMNQITAYTSELMGYKNMVEDIPPGHNLWMDCSKARHYGVCFKSVQDGLKACKMDEQSYGGIS